MLKISIITPSFNSVKFIEKCIQSVLNQNYPNFEHIVIDGGSNDGTVDILKKYPHLKWISEPDEGQSDALNKGFKMATGEIIGWLNADDYYLPNIFSLVVQYFLTGDEVDIIYGNWNFVDENEKYIKKFQSIPFDYKTLIYYGPFIGSTALFFKSDIIKEALLIDKKFKYAMDWEWYARLARVGKKFMFVNKTFACFRLHGDNQSNKYINMNKMDKLFTRAEQLGEGYAIKRYYGHHWGGDFFGGNLFEEISFRILWWFYRIKVILLKLIYLKFKKN